MKLERRSEAVIIFAIKTKNILQKKNKNNHLQKLTLLSRSPICLVVFDISTITVNFRQHFYMVFVYQRLFRTYKSSNGSSLLFLVWICSTQSPLTKVIKL